MAQPASSPYTGWKPSPLANGLGNSASPALQKLCIIDLDRRDEGVWAQYNPKEIGLDKSASWTPAASNGNPELQFSKSNARQLSLELFFDTYETAGPDGRPFDVHVEFIAKMHRLATVIDPQGREDERRPPRVMVVWGDDLPRFVGVVESVNAKYTMFLPGGRPVRATAALKLIEAERVKHTPRRAPAP